MIIMGIDPGLATTGWGVIDRVKSQETYLSTGVISTQASLTISARLGQIFDQVSDLIAQFSPQVVAVEELFFNTNAKTALIIGQARGVCVLAAERKGLEVVSYTPLQVKMAITGYGRADKRQIQKMVQKILKLDQIPTPDDAADALAVALTCGVSWKG